MTLHELCISLAAAGLVMAKAILHRFFVHHGITHKQRLAMRSGRTVLTSWARGTTRSTTGSTKIWSGLCSTTKAGPPTNMTRNHGVATGASVCAWAFSMAIARRTTIVAGLRMTGMVAPMTLDGLTNGDLSRLMSGRYLCLDCDAVTSRQTYLN